MTAKSIQKPTLSFIIPLMNEEHTLPELHERIAEQANEVARDWEIIFIDDGSTDRSWEVIEELAAKDSAHVRAIRFRRNQGKAAGLAAGYKDCSGEIVFTLDADLQDDPKEIPRFLEKLSEGDGWDIVSGFKAKRHDPWHKVLPSRVFNAMLSKVNGVKLHDHNCGFKCYRQEVVKALPMYGEMHRMVPSLASIEGYRTTEIVVEHHARQHGVSKYGVKRFLRGFLDMWSVFFVKNYRERPLHLMGGIALCCLFIAAALWGLAILPFFPDGLRSAFLSAAPAAAFAAPVVLMIGFLTEMMTNRHYSKEHPLPIIDRIDPANPDAEAKIVSIGATNDSGEDSGNAPVVLIADDDEITRTISSRLMKAEGWEVETAESSEEALAAISPKFDAVLLDIYMPGLSGIEALPKIKLLAPHAQVVVLSGSDQVKDGADAIKAGAFDFLSKPVKKDELLETLGRAIDQSRSLRPSMQTG